MSFETPQEAPKTEQLPTYDKTKLESQLGEKIQNLAQSMMTFQSDENLFDDSFLKVTMTFTSAVSQSKEFIAHDLIEIQTKVREIIDALPDDNFSIAGQVAFCDNQTKERFASRDFEAI